MDSQRRALLVGLLGCTVGAVAVVCLVSLRAQPQPTELMYGKGNDWGGFLESSYGHGNLHAHQPNELDASDLHLLKVAHKEELAETKKHSLSKKHDMAALKARDQRRAVLKHEEQALHKQQHAPPPAPFKPHAKHTANELTHKDKDLLRIAEHEMVKETHKALAAKMDDESAEAAHEKKVAAARAAKHTEALKAATLKAAQAKHTAHKRAVRGGEEREERSWGGWLPRLGGRKHAPGQLDAGALALLRSAKTEQLTQETKDEAAKARDMSDFKKVYGGKAVFRHSGRVAREARQEFNHIERHADVGLQSATAEDDTEASHAWGHRV